MGVKGWNWSEVEGLRVLGLEAGGLALSLLPEKGLDLDAIVHLPSGASLLSRHGESPERLRGFLAGGQGGSDYIPWFQGGWQDLLPSRLAIEGAERKGFRSAALEAWAIDHLEEGPEAVWLEASLLLPDSGLGIMKRLALSARKPLLRLEERVENRGAESLEFTWTQHLTFGAQLLEPCCRILLPSAARVFEPGRGTADGSAGTRLEAAALPRPEAPLPATGNRFLTLGGLEEARVRLENPDRGLGVELRWEQAAMPCLWFWAADEPWIRALGLEPSTTCLPDYAEAASAGMTSRLEPGESRALWLELGLYEL